MGGKKTTGVILREAFRSYRLNLKKLFIATLIIYGITYLYTSAFNAAGLDIPGIQYFFGNSTAAWGASGLASLIGSLLALVITSIIQIPANMFGYNSNDAALCFAKGETPKIGTVASHFKMGWRRYLGMAAWSTLWQSLWTLFCFFPGVVKQYSYMLAPYLIIEYPGMPIKQALKKSMEMTFGYKGRLFLLDVCVSGPFYIIALALSYTVALHHAPSLLFIGPLITLVSGMLLTQPVSYMMYAIAYRDIKQAAIEKGILPPVGSFPLSVLEDGGPSDISI